MSSGCCLSVEAEMEKGDMVVLLWEVERGVREFSNKEEMIEEIQRLRQVNHIHREIIAALKAWRLKLLGIK